MRNVADTGLQILYTLLQNVAQEEAAAQSFYQTYFCDILQHIFSVVTDTSHTAGELPLRYYLQSNGWSWLTFDLISGQSPAFSSPFKTKLAKHWQKSLKEYSFNAL